MLTAALIALLLLSTAALWFALARALALSRRAAHAIAELREQAALESAELREQLRGELTELRQQLAAETENGARRDSLLRELSAAVADGAGVEARREEATATVSPAEGRTDETDAASEASSPRVDATTEDTLTISAPAEETPTVSATTEETLTLNAATEEATFVAAEDVYALARGMDAFINAAEHPRELLGYETFERGVELSLRPEHSVQTLLARATGHDVRVACMSLEALARRAGGDDEVVVGSVLRDINLYYYWPRFFALRVLGAHAGRRVVARLVVRLNSSWRDLMPLQLLREFVAARAAAGETPTAEELSGELDSVGLTAERIADVSLTLGELGDALPDALREEAARVQGERAAFEFVKSMGRVWEPRAQDAGASHGEVFVLDALAARVSELEAAVKREPPRSVLLVGEPGTGKTSLVRALARRLGGDGWVVFEAAAADVLAGQTYIGQLEERVQSIVRHLAGRRALWVVPNFHEMLWAGRHRYSPVGLLDLLLPSIESGAVRIVGEVPADAYEQLLRLRPKLRTAMQTCRIAPLPDEETLELARRWAASRAAADATDATSSAEATLEAKPRTSEQTLREALQLAKQYLGDKAAPGNLLLFLDATARRLAADGEAARAIRLDDLLVTLSQLTGLPTTILDEREGLDLSELRAFFERRVLGQPEAVECLVERVAMIKSGLTDPTRPQGVFLFVGPTGTGKTEIAKTLAEFLFGSPERMIRLDMSELQTWESQSRILGESDETSDSTALVNLIRKQPFSVVLLDEFEKAHPAVWDLFLQVFDDGRLTDRRGNTADFRHCVVIMTSNLGATLPHGASIGFSQEQAQFAAASVERAVGRAFRREFVNRIDRVVVFRPLGRAVMRELLRKELNDVLRRRGLRTRQWAVEWDESAIEFLLEKGFTADLGARPLKRAVERYLLSPLALSIVNHQFPEGDQFLFVRQSPDGQALDVQFVDPDAPEQEETPTPATSEEEETITSARELRLEAVVFEPRGTPEELLLLREKYEEVAAQVEDEVWSRRKEEALRQIQSADFWTSPARFATLGAVEYMDRIEAGLDTAGRLLARLRGERSRLPSDLVGRLAEQLYLLDAACRGMAEGEPRDAFLLVAAAGETGGERAAGARFARRLARMYRRWAERRRMRVETIAERDGEGGYRALLAVSGYAAYTILRAEAGVHVLEIPQDEKAFNRARATVSVAAQPDEPAGHEPGALLRQAEQALAEADAPQSVVRRYREGPSPLVRDSARGWRTGKLERVLDGDFDIVV